MRSTTPPGSTSTATTCANGSSTPTSAPSCSATTSPNNIACKAFVPGSWVTRIRPSGRLCPRPAEVASGYCSPLRFASGLPSCLRIRRLRSSFKLNEFTLHINALLTIIIMILRSKRSFSTRRFSRCQLIVSEVTQISHPTSRQQITEPQNKLWSQESWSAMKTSFIRMWVGSLIAVMLCVATGAAQTVTGAVTGTVTDPSGAVLPGATVVAINTATSVQTAAKTNSGGVYSIRFLPIGTYQVEVIAEGFNKVTLPQFKLEK